MIVYQIYQKNANGEQWLGRVDDRGRVYQQERGPDPYCGRVDMDSGKIFAGLPGQDECIGWVELNSGRIFYCSAKATTKCVGEIDGHGRIYRKTGERWRSKQILGRISVLPIKLASDPSGTKHTMPCMYALANVALGYSRKDLIPVKRYCAGAAALLLLLLPAQNND